MHRSHTAVSLSCLSMLHTGMHFFLALLWSKGTVMLDNRGKPKQTPQVGSHLGQSGCPSLPVAPRYAWLVVSLGVFNFACVWLGNATLGASFAPVQVAQPLMSQVSVADSLGRNTAC